jgi:formylglycine-generating enzyme required for sulfatase activity
MRWPPLRKKKRSYAEAKEGMMRTRRVKVMTICALLLSADLMSAQIQRVLARDIPDSPSPRANFQALITGEAVDVQNASVWKAWRDHVTGMAFVWVPSGEFDMGSNSSEASDDEKPVHRVFVDGFWMGKHEVTQDEWRAVMGSNPSFFKNGGSFPVENISWEDAQEFIRRLNSRTGMTFRLPTEAEWEYACRSWTTEDRYWRYLTYIAWFGGNSGGSTHAVGQKQPNNFGLYDMLGNVWEWCQDWYGSYWSGDVKNPSGPSMGSYRVVRGGEWNVGAKLVRSSVRGGGMPSGRNNSLGFRLARTK